MDASDDPCRAIPWTRAEAERAFDGPIPAGLLRALRFRERAEEWRDRAEVFATLAGNERWLARARAELAWQRRRLRRAARHRFEQRQALRAGDRRALLLEPEGGLPERIAAYREARRVVEALEAHREALARGDRPPFLVASFGWFMSIQSPLAPDAVPRRYAAE